MRNRWTMAAAMMAWVTDSPNWANTRVTSLDNRFLSSMQGGLGIGANLDHWKDADFATAASGSPPTRRSARSGADLRGVDARRRGIARRRAARASGAYWMGKGLRATLKGDFVGAAFVFDAVR